jgi:Leucine-rich repeat (LRR) protein
MVEPGTKTPSIYGTKMAVFKLDFSDRDLSELPEDESLPDVRSLDLAKNRFASLEFIDKCPNLIEINAAENQIGDGLEKFGEVMFLSILSLSANLLESLTGFPRSEILTSLDLSKNHLKTVSDLPSLPLLRNLNLSHNSITDLQLPALPCLHVLNLSGNLIAKLELPRLPSLRILDASQNSIEEIQVFEEDSLPFVWQCDLRSNQIATTNVLKSLEKLPMLWYLMIANNPVVAADGAHVAPVMVILPRLTNLDEKLVNAKDKVKACLTVKKLEDGRVGDDDE